MNCSSFRQYIDDYIDNDISNGIKHDMLKHAEKCPECQKELEDMQKLVKCINSMPEISVPDDFLAKLNQRIDSEHIPVKVAKSNIYKRIFNNRTYSVAAACVLLFALVKADIPSMLPYSNNYKSQSIESALSKDARTRQFTVPTPNTSADTLTTSEPASSALPTTAPTVAADTTPALPSPEITSTVSPAESVSAAIPETVSAVSPTTEQVTQQPTPPTDNPINDNAGIQPFSLNIGQDIQPANESPTVTAKGAEPRQTVKSADVKSAVNTESGEEKDKSYVYDISVNAEHKDTAISILYSLGAVYNKGYYVLSPSNAAKFMTKLSENGIYYTKSTRSDVKTLGAHIYLHFK